MSQTEIRAKKARLPPNYIWKINGEGYENITGGERRSSAPAVTESANGGCSVTANSAESRNEIRRRTTLETQPETNGLLIRGAEDSSIRTIFETCRAGLALGK